MLIDTYSRKLLNEKSDILGTDDVVHARRIVFRALGGSQAWEQTRLWKFFFRLFLVEMFPLHITFSLLNMFVDPSLFDKLHQIPLNHWLFTWRARFQHLKVKILLCVECSTIGVVRKKSGILHPDAWPEQLYRNLWA